jgi:Lrp/AsnC family transcriptional regulator for asnA, asnC and gidA
VIDETDAEIIRHLQTDGRMPYSQLGQLVGLSDAAARQRVNRLTERGVIDIVAVTDPARLGLGLQAMLGITVTASASDVADTIGAIDAADYVVLTAGRYDVIAEVVCADHRALVDLLTTIRAIDGVHTVETLTYLGLVKQTYDWGVG